MYIVVVRKNEFSPSAQAMKKSDHFYFYNDELKANKVAEATSNNPMVVSVTIAKVEKKFVKGVDIYGRDEKAES